jgi:hypothetical protein
MELSKVTVTEVKESIAYCGLVCMFCHLAGSCGGCKSKDNCCGRHLSSEGCYQYKCCVERGIAGCWECEDFSCGMDMFSEAHDIRLKAFVRCAKEDGVGKLAEYVLRNQQNGIMYGHKKDYDGLESEDAVLRLLRAGSI